MQSRRSTSSLSAGSFRGHNGICASRIQFVSIAEILGICRGFLLSSWRLLDLRWAPRAPDVLAPLRCNVFRDACKQATPTASGKPKKRKFEICLKPMCLFCRRCSTAHRANAKWSGAMPSCDGVAPDHSIAILFKYSGIKRPAPDSEAYSVLDSEQLKRVASSTHAGCKTTETGWPERVAPSMTTLKQLTS